jgi:hypothetical protein
MQLQRSFVKKAHEKKVVIQTKYVDREGYQILKKEITFNDPIIVSKGGWPVGVAENIRFIGEKMLVDIILQKEVDGYPSPQFIGLKLKSNSHKVYGHPHMHDITILDSPADPLDTEVIKLSEYEDSQDN